MLSIAEELTKVRAEIARLTAREAALRAALPSRDGAALPGMRPGWPIQRVKQGATQHSH